MCPSIGSQGTQIQYGNGIIGRHIRLASRSELSMVALRWVEFQLGGKIVWMATNPAAHPPIFDVSKRWL